MADWYTVRRRLQKSTATFQVVGRPFAFVPVFPHGDPNTVLRCWPDIDLSQTAPSEEEHACYDLAYRTRDDAEEIYENGWYLTGAGQHLLWCGAGLSEAVDAAQEIIAMDGKGCSPDVLQGSRDPDRLHALLMPDFVWQDDSLWFGMFTGKAPGEQ